MALIFSIVGACHSYQPRDLKTATIPNPETYKSRGFTIAVDSFNFVRGLLIFAHQECPVQHSHSILIIKITDAGDKL